MLTDLLHRWFSRTAPEAGTLGLWKEHRDIAKRHDRVRTAWAGHLAESRAVILATARGIVETQGSGTSAFAKASADSSCRDATGEEDNGQSGSGGRCLVIGAGDCLDVPVADLAQIFEEVLLADVVVGREVRRLERQFPGRVRGIVWDASGALAQLTQVRESVGAREAERIFATADPGAPPGGAVDLIVSANCVSQLGLVPGHSLPAHRRGDKELPDRLGQAAGKRHVEWLRQQSGVRLLLADVAELDVGPDGKLLKRVELRERFGLPPPVKSWRWDLAPIPEWSSDFARVHEVGAWLWR